jgi:hypothetical protein
MKVAGEGDLRNLGGGQCRETGIAFFMKQTTKLAPIPKDLFIRE